MKQRRRHRCSHRGLRSKPAQLMTLAAALLLPGFAEAARQDFDGDGKDDLALYDSSAGSFVVRFSSTGGFTPPITLAPGVFGAGGYPVVGQFNSPTDGKSDLAVYDRATATWRFNALSNGAAGPVVPFGNRGDLPVAADYDGNGCTDFGVYRPSDGTWHIQLCGAVGVAVHELGSPVSIPVPGDYDGDGKADIGVFDRADATWTFYRSSDQSLQTIQFGNPGDVPVPGSFLGAGRTDLIVYRPATGTFFVRNRDDGATLSFPIGIAGDLPDILDVDGDGKMDLVVFRPSDRNYYIVTSTGPRFVIKWTAPFAPFNSVPHSGRPLLAQLPLFAGEGDLNGDLASDIALVNRSNTGNRWFVQGATGSAASVLFGLAGDTLLAGDTDGDSTFEPVVTRSGAPVGGTSYLYWYLARGQRGFQEVQFGLNGDKPLLGDFDCDGTDDLAVARSDGFYLYWYIATLAGNKIIANGLVHGLKGDSVFAADLNRNGCDELVAARGYGSNGPAPGQIVWYGLDLVTGNSTGNGVLWGLTSTDQPLPPADDNGDGSADFSVLRTQNGKNTVYILRNDGTTRTVDVSSSFAFPGSFSAPEVGEIGSFVPATSRLMVSRFDGATNEVPLVQVNPTDLVVPAGRALSLSGNGGGAPATPAPTGGPGLNSVCRSIAGGGWLWKPKSQDSGGTREGKPMILLSRFSIGSPCLDVYASNGAVVTRFGKFESNRFYSGYGCGGGGMSGEAIASKAKSLAGSSTVYVQGNGGTCFGPVGNPAARNDRR